jgi:CSLREA domain-containing protein
VHLIEEAAMNVRRLTLLLALISTLPAGATVFQVTKTADTLDGACDNDCSLREAVVASNTNPGADEIVLGPGIYTLTREGAFEDGSSTGDLDVRDALTIRGAGAGRSLLDGGGIDRVLHVIRTGNASLEIRGVTVRHGMARPLPNVDGGSGGGISARGPLTVVGCLITGNQAAWDGGGIEAGSLTVRDTTVSDNVAQNTGGGIRALEPVRLTNVTVSGNRAQRGGGLLVVVGVVEMTGVTVTGNTASEIGGLYISHYGCIPEDEECNSQPSSLTLSRSVLAGNSAPYAPDCAGVVHALGGWNVFGVSEACVLGPTDRYGTKTAPLDPKLSPLGGHGGSTPTHLLLPDSPALDIAPSADCTGTLDQRGQPRPSGSGCDAGAVELSPDCPADGETLCLGADGRFQVRAHWITKGTSGPGRPFPLTSDTGAIWFFGPDNLELILKVLDGCGVNDRFWVFLAGLTDVAVEITVEDTKTGTAKTYTHAGKLPLQPRLDTDAFDTCL